MFLLLAIRLYWGYAFLISGWGKLHDVSSVADYFATLDIPFPLINTYLVSWVEFLGGFFLLIGFAARLVAIPLSINMIVAYLTAHYPSVQMAWENPDGFIKESPFNFLLASLIIFAFGPGKISVDYCLEKLFFKNTIREPQ